MADIRFANEAVADLSAIDEFSVAHFGEEVGEAYMRGFETVFALLKAHPNAGSATPDYGKAFRCFTHRSHRIFYMLEGETVLIVRVLHHAMDAKRVLKGVVR